MIVILPLVFGWDPYPYNPYIHTLGNHGFLGRIHAEVAPVITNVIDNVAYNRRDVRKEVLKNETKGRRVLDFGCGVGFSTSSNDGSVGIDTSFAMIEKARKMFPDKEFELGQAEYWTSIDRDFDVVTVMYMFHETPQEARQHIVEQAKLIAKEKVIIVDISPEYTPSHSMLAGEPYLMEYLSQIRNDLCDFSETVLVPGHVHCWVYNKLREAEAVRQSISEKKVRGRHPISKKKDRGRLQARVREYA